MNSCQFLKIDFTKKNYYQKNTVTNTAEIFSGNFQFSEFFLQKFISRKFLSIGKNTAKNTNLAS